MNHLYAMPPEPARNVDHTRRAARPSAHKSGLWAGAAAALLSLATTLPVEAQSIRLDRFHAAERADDGFAVRRLGDIGHLRFGLNVLGDYANDPLVAEAIAADGSGSRRSIVHEQLAGGARLSLSAWDRVIVFAGLDGTARMRGTAPGNVAIRKADKAGLGTTDLGLRLRLVGSKKSVFSLGIEGAVELPTAGKSQAYRGERRVNGRGGLILDVRASHFHAALNVGADVREKVRVASSSVGSEGTFGLALGVPLHERFELIAEGFGGTSTGDFFATHATHVEWLAGAKANVAGLYFGAAAGTGVGSAVGTPDVRVVGQLGLLTTGRVDAPPAPPPLPPPPPPDSDGDGLIDRDDRCPRDAEDKDDFEDEDGCPDLDNDKDGVPDDRDPCMNEPEDMDGFEDESGCPDPDNDQDGILDAEDVCPNEAGVIEERGCKARVKISDSGEMTIDEQIQFESGKDIILGQSYGILEAVRNTLERHPEVVRVRVEGHTDSKGNDRKNLKLSQARAKAVAMWLVERGIAELRFEAYGCGELHPLTDNGSEEGRRLNRRVAFQVVEPTPSDPTLARAPLGCKAARISVVKLRH